MKLKPYDGDNMSSIDDASPADWDRASKAIRDAVDHPPHYNAGEIETIAVSYTHLRAHET